MRLRQVALVAKDLEPVVETLCEVLGIEVSFQDPGVATFGLVNAVMPVGDTFLEVVSPDHEGTSAGRLLDRRGGDGGYMVILQVEDLELERERLETTGTRVVWETDTGDMQTIHLHPRDVGGAIVSLDWADPPEHWRWAGPDWREKAQTHVVAEVAGVEIQSDDPGGLAKRWAEVLGRPARDAQGGSAIDLDRGGLIRFVADTDGRGEGVSGLILRATDADRVRYTARGKGLLEPDGRILICGTRIELLD